MRGIERSHGICRQTLSAWLKGKAEQFPPLEATLTPVDPEQTPVLELDELWSFVFNKDNKIWVWIVLKRETREVVAYACGGRSKDTCRIRWDSHTARL